MKFLLTLFLFALPLYAEIPELPNFEVPIVKLAAVQSTAISQAAAAPVASVVPPAPTRVIRGPARPARVSAQPERQMNTVIQVIVVTQMETVSLPTARPSVAKPVVPSKRPSPTRTSASRRSSSARPSPTRSSAIRSSSSIRKASVRTTTTSRSTSSRTTSTRSSASKTTSSETASVSRTSRRSVSRRPRPTGRRSRRFKPFNINEYNTYKKSSFELRNMDMQRNLNSGATRNSVMFAGLVALLIPIFYVL